jgi:hypothetical protein
MKQSIVLLFLLKSLFLLAQPQFVSPGAEWWYAYKGGFISAEGWDHIYYEKDTVVAGFACKKLISENFNRYSSNDTVPFNITYQAKFVRQQGDSVFLYNNPSWMLRWRTNPNVGDTYTMPIESSSNQMVCFIKVDSIKNIDINGQAMKKIYQSGRITFLNNPNIYAGGGNVEIYSHIGPSYSTFDYITCWGAFDCYPSNLCRFKNDITPLYQFNSAHCEVITSTQNPDIGSNLVVSPNPCSDYISFDFGQLAYLNDLSISIVDQTGRLVTSRAINAGEQVTISTSTLPSGIYNYLIRHKTGAFAGRFSKL